MIIQTQWPIRRGFGGRVLISGTMPASLTLRGQVVAVNLVPKFGCTRRPGSRSVDKPAYLGRLVEPLPFGISAGDPLTLPLVLLLFALLIVSSCYLPARRAGRIDPHSALRHE